MSHYGAYIAGTGSYVPEKRLTNDDLAKLVEHESLRLGILREVREHCLCLGRLS